tara:strand:- start:112 stop:1026 length:915 start_codon:yes stop_codon:yes gene_type:complete
MGYTQKNNPFQKRGPLKMIGGKKSEKKIDPEEKPIKDEKWTASDTGHLALDLMGMVPLVGEVADGLNASWYAKEGKYGDAALSGAAMIPGAGWAAGGTKLAKHMSKLKRVLGFGDKTKDVSKIVDAGKDINKNVEVSNIVKSDDLFMKKPTNYGDAYEPAQYNSMFKGAIGGMTEQGKNLDKMGYDVSKMLNKDAVKYHGIQGGRTVMEVSLPNGGSQLFYKSSGLAGKSGKGVGGTTEGMWQPFGGFANITHQGRPNKNWFIKSKDYENFYGSKSFRDIAGNLDKIAAEKGIDMSKQALASQR